jgi:hypothetical protein
LGIIFVVLRLVKLIKSYHIIKIITCEIY